MTDPIYLPESSGSTPYVGIASFLKLSLVAAAETRDYDFLALGMPFDEDTSSQPAAHFGPWAIRGASTIYHEGSVGFLNAELRTTILAGARLTGVKCPSTQAAAPPTEPRSSRRMQASSRPEPSRPAPGATTQ